MHRSSRLQAALSLLLAFASTGLAVKTVVPPGQTECIAEEVTPEHFEIPGGPRIDGRVLVSGYSQYYVPFITVKVLSPQGEQIWQQAHIYSETHFNVGARGPGTYKVCFVNPWESRTDAIVDLVYFTIAHLRAAGGRVVIPRGSPDARTTEVAGKEHLEDVKRTILGMSEFMQVIRGSQTYLNRKLERHQSTMVSNKSRTQWYAVLEMLVVMAVSAVQIMTITRFFRTGKIKLSV